MLTLLKPLGGGNYGSRSLGYWIVDEWLANLLSAYPDRTNLRSSTAAVDSGVLIGIETGDRTVCMATGSGGMAACSIIEQGLAGFLIEAEVRDFARLWNQMYRATSPYVRKGISCMAICVVDPALWDLLGQSPAWNIAIQPRRQRHQFGFRSNVQWRTAAA